MKEYDLQLGLASEMVRILGTAGQEDKNSVRTPEKAMAILRERVPNECSARYGDIDFCTTEALALQMFFSIFWGESLDVRCDDKGCVSKVNVESHHCTDQECCGPLPIWADETSHHLHHH